MMKDSIWPHLLNENNRHLIPHLHLLPHRYRYRSTMSMEQFYFWSDELVTWCFKYYWPCRSPYISFHATSSLIWSSSEIREAQHCPSLSLNWKILRSMMSLFMLRLDHQILICVASTCDFNLISHFVKFSNCGYWILCHFPLEFCVLCPIFQQQFILDLFKLPASLSLTKLFPELKQYTRSCRKTLSRKCFTEVFTEMQFHPSVWRISFRIDHQQVLKLRRMWKNNTP